MFRDTDLENHIKTNKTIQTGILPIMEWNLNDFENISNYGNYRYRTQAASTSTYLTLPESYDSLDVGFYYTNGTVSTIQSQALIDDLEQPLTFTTEETDRYLYYDLKECFSQNRPRSGINKPLYLNNGKYVDNIKSARRPRYYMPSRYDSFKYWNSFRKEDAIIRGLSSLNDANGTGYIIDDVAPFVVYKNPVFANRIVIKLQTNLAETEGSQIKDANNNLIDDPLSNRNKSSIPKRWKIQYLDTENNWITALSFNEDSIRRDGSNIIKWDGHVELYYGLKIPNQYKENFNLVDYIDVSSQLPNNALDGESYIVGSSVNSVGILYIWDIASTSWKQFVPEYGFSLLEDNDVKKLGIIKKLVNPRYFTSGGKVIFREVERIKGLRVVVETMFGPETTFDLIEMSPRLKADISDYLLGFDVNKAIPNNVNGLPIGNLLASNGSMTLMNHDFAFHDQNIFENNQGSIIYNLLNPKTKVEFYEIVKSVAGYDKYIPIKTMFIEKFPKGGSALLDIDLEMRDGFYKFENENTPSIFLQNVSLTYAIAVLLDNIGFSNYVFKVLENYDPVIPYLFVEPEASVAEILQRISLSTQSAMFFDEYNNFVVMSKEYLFPSESQREVDWIMYGQVEGNTFPNIIEISQQDTKVINDGAINYTTRYIQRAVRSLKQASYVDEDRSYGYQPVVLWEAPAQTSYKTINEKSKTNNFTLSAVALNSDLSASSPTVVNRQIINNIIDIGENVYWLSRLQGYLYANGEIIKYDAVQYSIPTIGLVWISDELEYQKYFSELPFNGKMYPTGLVRIYTEPYYEIIKNNLGEDITVYKNGNVRKNGRGQFGTSLVGHYAGIDSYWSDENNLNGYSMDTSYLFTTTPTNNIVRPPTFNMGQANTWINNKSKESSVNSIIANFLRETIPSDDIVKTLRTTSKATVQSSALVFSGPKVDISKNQISYVRKELDADYKHFGTRMRIIGKKEANEKIQTPLNATEYYVIPAQAGGKDVAISGGSGGIAIMVPPISNSQEPIINKPGGYYFEICSLTADNLELYNKTNSNTGEPETVLHNVLFYKVVDGMKDGKQIAVPHKLWGGLAKILIDEGNFVGQDRLSQEANPTVYDLAMEYKDIGSVRRFYLYLNGHQIATVDDESPIQKTYNNLALFTRGGSKCMFENVYALKNQYSQESKSTVVEIEKDTFGVKQINSSDALKKYALSGFVQASHLSGISSQNTNKYKIYYEEFGTILRECYYFNIKYDKAYPAFRAILKPTVNNEKTYTTSGFSADPYGAEFLIFNATDKTIVLDETSGNHLEVIGITFTQNTTNTLTVDDYYKNKSNFADPLVINNTIVSPDRQNAIYQDIKTSRSKYGRNEFNLEAVYIQSQDQANELMDWMMSRLIYPKQIVSIEVFGVPHLQLGDVIQIDYNIDNDNYVDPNKRFTVVNIDYGYSEKGPSSVIRVVEI